MKNLEFSNFKKWLKAYLSDNLNVIVKNYEQLKLLNIQKKRKKVDKLIWKLNLLGFEFLMLANHDKTWQKLSLISLKWSTLKPKKKKLKFGIKTNELQAGWFNRSKDRFDWSKIAYQQNQQT